MGRHLGAADPGDVAQLRELNKTTLVGGNAGGVTWLGELPALEVRWAYLQAIVDEGQPSDPAWAINQAELADVERQIATMKAIAKEKDWL